VRTCAEKNVINLDVALQKTDNEDVDSQPNSLRRGAAIRKVASGLAKRGLSNAKTYCLPEGRGTKGPPMGAGRAKRTADVASSEGARLSRFLDAEF